MSNQRGTFAKRQREQDKKDKARAKRERLTARRSEAKPGDKGPPIAWDEAVQVTDSELPLDETATDDTATDDTTTTTTSSTAD